MKNNEYTLAVANLAAAAIAANPGLSMSDAVKQASDSLRSSSLTQKDIESSIKPDRIKCFEDNTWHIMLRRYIKRKFNLTPDKYREKWGLPNNYPMLAPDYSKKRSKIAKKTGLGRK